MSSTIGGVRIVDMPDLGAFTDDSSIVGEHAGSGRFSSAALRSYVGLQYLPLVGGSISGNLAVSGNQSIGGFLTVSGDVDVFGNAYMGGNLSLAHDPAAAMEAATRQYVDTRPLAVANIAALRALTAVSQSNAVWVDGYYAGSDGGEGMFGLSGDTTTADNGGTVIVDAAARRWYRQGVRGTVTIKQFGAAGDGTGDQTASIEAAITWIAGQGGGIVRVPVGNYRITGTLGLQSNYVRLVGDSMYGSALTFTNATTDCIVVGGLSTLVSDIVISTLSIIGAPGKTAGSAINAYRIAYCQFSHINVSGVPNGMTVQILNNVWIDHCQIICTTAGSNCISWHSPATATDRSDVLTITDTVVNAQGYGQTGLYIDGNCQTLRVSRLGIIHCGYGLVVDNSAASTQYFPQFIYCNDIEIDGVDSVGMQIKAGRQMHFVNTTVFNAGGGPANTVALSIGSDASHSVTNYIGFTNCAFAGANHEGVVCYARQVDFVNCYIGDNSVAGLNAYVGVSILNEGTGAGPAGSISFTGGRIGSVFGDLPYQQDGIYIGPLCSRITITGVDFTNCATRAIVDASAGFGNVLWHGCIGVNGAPLPDRLQQVATDPSGADLMEGMVWENVTGFTYKVCLNGVVKTVTVT